MICLSNASYSEYSDVEYTHPSGSKFRLLKEDAKYFIQYEASDYKDYFEVPEEIVNQKNCFRFLKWQHDTIPGTFPRFPCPWETYGASRKVNMCGLELNIPRRFLSASSKVGSDGKETKLMFDFVFPEMKPGFGNGRESISVWMEDISDYIGKYYKDRDDYLLYQYWRWLGVHRPDDVILTTQELDCREKQCSISFTKKGFDQDLKRTVYFVKETVAKRIDSEEEYARKIAATSDLEYRAAIKFFHEDAKQHPVYYKDIELYTNDDPKRAQDFIACSLGERNDQHSCHALFFYKDIYFKLNFLKTNLINYNNIKKQLLLLIDTWSTHNDR